MPIESSVTRGPLLVEIARMVGAYEFSGTAASGTTTTLTHTQIIHPNANQLKDYQLYIYKGTAIGQKRWLSGSGAGTGVLTFLTGTAPDASSLYLLLKPGWDVQVCIDGINEAIRNARWHIMEKTVDSTLIFQDLLMGDGAFERWGNGNTSAPNGWTLFGTGAAVSRVDATLGSTLGRPVDESHRYAAKLVSDGTNQAGLRFSIQDYQRYGADVFTVRVDVNVNTASRVTVRLLDGTNTYASSAAAGTADRWEQLEILSKTMTTNPTKLDVELLISSGSAITAYLDNTRCLWESQRLSGYNIPVGIDSIYRVERESSERGQFTHVFPDGSGLSTPSWEVDGTESSPVLDFTTPAWGRAPNDGQSIAGRTPGIFQDRRIRLVGQVNPTLTDDDLDTIPIDPEYVKGFAAWYWLRAMPEKQSLLPYYEAQWRQALRRARAGLLPGSHVVRRA